MAAFYSWKWYWETGALKCIPAIKIQRCRFGRLQGIVSFCSSVHKYSKKVHKYSKISAFDLKTYYNDAWLLSCFLCTLRTLMCFESWGVCYIMLFDLINLLCSILSLQLPADCRLAAVFVAGLSLGGTISQLVPLFSLFLSVLPGHPCLNFFAESDTPHPCRIPTPVSDSKCYLPCPKKF